MAVSMMSTHRMALRQPAGAARRTPSQRCAVVVRASQDRQQREHLTFPQVAIRSMIAATAAAGLSLAPAPATAADVFTYGRENVIAAKEKLFEEAQAKAVAAMEELAAAKGKVELAPTRAEIGPTRAGVVETSDSVPSAAVSISGEAENTPAGSVLSAAASSLSNLFTKQ